MRYKMILTTLALSFTLVSLSYANVSWNVDEKLDKMKMELNLTDDQVKAIRPILKDCKEREEQMEKEKEDKLSQILSPEQMKEWKEKKKEMHERMKEMKDKKY